MSYYPNLEEAKKELQGTDFKRIPISYTMDLHKEAIQLCQQLKAVSHNVFILESCEDSKNWGRYSFLGFDPTLELTCKDGTVHINSGINLTFENKSPHTYIRKIMEENKSPKLEGMPSFTGGLVGYFAYDFIKYKEPKLKLDANDEEGFNDVDLMLFHKIIAIDHQLKKIILIVNIEADNIEINYQKALHELKLMSEIMEAEYEVKEEKGKLLEPLKPIFDRESFCRMVEKAKEYIYEGDIFQVVLSNRLSAAYKGSIFSTYQKLRKTNPSPYLFYFASKEIEIAGASPETLVKVQEGNVTTFPLAGTRPRGKTKEEDESLERELLADEKECAEHNMLVDLGRNDIGKISKFGSVTVDKYMQIERFSHVMHIGSTVSGQMQNKYDVMDAVDAILPAGTLSGAPKIRACEIINELEQVKRGIYGGAIGYLDFSGNLDTCIAIRLAYKKNDTVFVRSGAGIVADSIPEKEYEECIHKAKAVVSVLEEVDYDSFN